MKKTAILLPFILMVVAYSCTKNAGTGTVVSGTSVTLDLPAIPDKYFNSSTKNDSANKVATLGRVLFYDTHLSLNNTISCGSCHKQAVGFADAGRFSKGYEGVNTKRNTPGITSLTANSRLFWDGRENNLQNLIMRPVTNHVEMGIDDPNVLPAKLSELPYYSQLFKNAFGDANVTIDRISIAVSTFMQSIGSSSPGSSRFDQYQQGNTSAMTAQEISGMNLFDVKYNCKSCHGGNSGYSGNSTFRDIGLDNEATDPGRAAITGFASDKGKFKVPNLRNVALTAPYMHDGRYATLEDVVEHYSHDIRNSTNLDQLLKDKYGNPMSFNISEIDKQAIVAFLKTLTDYSTITDPKFSNPFKIN